MGPFDSCRLIHINLTSYIVDPFTDEAYIDKELLYKHSYEAMRLADDLVDLELEAIDKIINVVKDEKDFVEFYNKENTFFQKDATKLNLYK